MSDPSIDDLFRRAKANQRKRRAKERRRNCLRWPTWAVVVLLYLAAIGFSPAFALSRWSGAVMGLVLAFAAMGLGQNDDGSTVWSQDGGEDGVPLVIGCFCIGLLLAGGTSILENYESDDFTPLKYSTIIRFWTLVDVAAAVLFTKTILRINKHWKRQDDRAVEAAVAAHQASQREAVSQNAQQVETSSQPSYPVGTSCVHSLPYQDCTDCKGFWSPEGTRL